MKYKILAINPENQKLFLWSYSINPNRDLWHDIHEIDSDKSMYLSIELARFIISKLKLKYTNARFFIKNEI